MKQIERILIKLLIIQFFILLFVQCVVLQSEFAPYVTKVSYYEGVVKESLPELMETLKFW